MKFSQAVAVGFAPLAMAGKGRRSNQLQPPSAMPRDMSDEMLAARQVVIVDGMSGGGLTPGSGNDILIIWANPGGAAPTQTLNEQVTVTQTVTVPAGQQTVVPGADGSQQTLTEGQTGVIAPAAATHTVTVGGPSGLIFQPDQLQAVPQGDMVVFEFMSKNHSVTQSPFDTPCDAMPNGMDTGFQPNPDDAQPPPQVAMQVTTDKPLWFYCKQANHCGQGMVFSINPTAAKTQAQFKELAIAQKGTGGGTPIVGGAPPAGSPGSTPVGTPPAGSTPVETPPAGGAGSVTPGNGVVEGGQCICQVSCSTGSFPSVENQGLGNTGGIAGSIPMQMGSIG